jgi:hypothetical protein
MRIGDLGVQPDEVDPVLSALRDMLADGICADSKPIWTGPTGSDDPVPATSGTDSIARSRPPVAKRNRDGQGTGLSMTPSMRRVAGEFLMAPAGVIVSRRSLIEAASLNHEIVREKLVDVYVCRLRRVLELAGAKGSTIECAYKRGYVLRHDCRALLADLIGWRPPVPHAGDRWISGPDLGDDAASVMRWPGP